jgi:hypothetical protein
MLYNIQISGGFTGLPRLLAGELNLSDQQQTHLKKVLDQLEETQINTNLRDSFIYDLKFTIGKGVYKSKFCDENMPDEIRKVLDRIILIHKN